MENIEKCLNQLVFDSRNDEKNFNLAYAYESMDQYAAAISYYLRCAEFTKNDVLASESLLRCAGLLNKQGGRDQKELYFIKHAIAASPNSPQPYYIASLYFSWRSGTRPEKRLWLDSYMYANLAINIVENNLECKQKFRYQIGEYQKHNLYYQKAYVGTNIGKITEAYNIYNKILSNFEIGDNEKNFIIHKMSELKIPQDCKVIENNINKISEEDKNDYIDKNNKTKQNIIPKNIFQTWKTELDDISSEMLYYINSWKKHNPNYNYIFYNDNQCYEFIRDNFDNHVLDAYSRLKPGAFKCDLWRYCVLYIHGGFYADIDTLCLSSLEDVKQKNIDFICPIDLNPNIGCQYNLFNGFIGSIPKHPILKMCIDHIVNTIKETEPDDKVIIINISGPGCLGININKYLNREQNTSFVGKEGNINNIKFLKFNKDNEYIYDISNSINILQNKNGNPELQTAYKNECSKIKNFFCYGKFGEFTKIENIVNYITFDTTNTNNNIILNTNKKINPNIIVIDDFYKDPDQIRDYALSLTYQQPENHGAVGYRCEYGRKIEDGTKQLFEKLLHRTIPNGNNHGEWNYSTNGCFQWCNAEVPIVYHCDSQKYAAIIYLTPDAPPNCGTSFFRHKKYKIRNSEIFSKSDWYQSDLNYKEPHLDKTQWEAVDNIGNVYNRLVIFDAQYIHAVTEYFGEDINNSRLFQLFFFNIN